MKVWRFGRGGRRLRRRRARLMMRMMRAELQGVAGGSEVFRTPRRAAVYLNSVKRRAASFCCSKLAFCSL